MGGICAATATPRRLFPTGHTTSGGWSRPLGTSLRIARASRWKARRRGGPPEPCVHQIHLCEPLCPGLRAPENRLSLSAPGLKPRCYDRIADRATVGGGVGSGPKRPQGGLCTRSAAASARRERTIVSRWATGACPKKLGMASSTTTASVRLPWVSWSYVPIGDALPVLGRTAGRKGEMAPVE